MHVKPSVFIKTIITNIIIVTYINGVPKMTNVTVASSFSRDFKGLVRFHADKARGATYLNLVLA